MRKEGEEVGHASYDPSMIGVEGEPRTEEVEEGAIRRFARAIDDPNPLYSDDEAAKASPAGGILAPPTFFTTFREAPIPDIKLQFGRVNLHGGMSYEYFEPLRAGDRITYSNKVTHVEEKQGRTGAMVLYTIETRFTNQNGLLVAIGRSTLIRRE